MPRDQGPGGGKEERNRRRGQGESKSISTRIGARVGGKEKEKEAKEGGMRAPAGTVVGASLSKLPTRREPPDDPNGGT